MNLQQLEYIVAVDKHRHFVKAANSCFVTQPTLSMMVQKLEDELGLRIFDRSKQPVTPTPEGIEIIQKAKQILQDAAQIKVFASELIGEIKGELHLAVIPTLAPYLLPLFLKQFSETHPLLKVFVKEMVTDEIILKLKCNELDMGLLATPLNEPMLKEHHLFYEAFLVYASQSENLPKKRYLLPEQINPNHLWLLEEGHCFRNQIFNLCELKSRDQSAVNLFYEAGSIETLINLVDQNAGITIIPELASRHLSTPQKNMLRDFAQPTPVREISLVVNKSFPRSKLVEMLKESIIANYQKTSSDKNTRVNQAIIPIAG